MRSIQCDLCGNDASVTQRPINHAPRVVMDRGPVRVTIEWARPGLVVIGRFAPGSPDHDYCEGCALKLARLKEDDG